MIALHVCWLCDPWRSTREKYLAAWRDLGWRVVLWADLERSGLRESPVEGVELRSAEEIVDGASIARALRYAALHGDHGTASDLFRYEALVRLGGAYADLDVLPLASATPALLDPLRGPRFNFCALSTLEIRLILSPAAHPLLVELRNAAVRNENGWVAGGGWLRSDASMHGVLARTAQRMARPIVERYAREHGVTLEHFLLRGAIETATPEGQREHFVDKGPAARRIAASLG